MKRLRQNDGSDRSESSADKGKLRKLGSSGEASDTQKLPEDPLSNHAQCTSIQAIEALHAYEKNQESHRVMRLGSLDSPESRSCRVCQLFSSVKSPSEVGGPLKPQSLYVHWISRSDIWGREGSILVVASEDSKDDLSYTADKNGAIACTESTSYSKPMAARRIDPYSIDFGLVRQWISLCKTYHEKCNRYITDAAKPRNLKLIDCETRQIVQAQSQKYIALSYVWGENTTYNDLPTAGKLPHNLPLTIEDAITATKRLQPPGHQYLWIDRYCIDQTNNREKNEQIWQMDTIYRNAEVTLVAAAGEDPNFGLPGVSRTCRSPQATACIGGVEFVSILPHPEDAINRSKWAERGWTYQEGYFSIRRLIFLKEQVYFSCWTGAAAETIRHLDENGVPHAVDERNSKDQEADQILGHLSRYSGRHLTHDVDAVRAVAGVFNDYSSFRKGVTAHYQGIPIPRYSLLHRFTQHSFYAQQGDQPRRVTNAFLIGLTWQNRSPGSRRNIWPSWTWADWVVPFGYANHGIYRKKGSGGFTLGIDFITQPSVAIETLNGVLLDFQDRSTLERIEASTADLSKFIWIKSWTFDFEIYKIDEDNPVDFVNYCLPLPQRCLDRNKGLTERYYACLKDEELDFKVPLWPMHPSYSRDHPSGDHRPRFAPGLNPSESEGRGGQVEEVLGIMLSKHQVESRRYKTRFSFNLMVVQKSGKDYYERIGHCSVDSEQLRDLAKRCGPVEEGWVFGWSKYHKTTSKLTQRYLRQKRIRIG